MAKRGKGKEFPNAMERVEARANEHGGFGIARSRKGGEMWEPMAAKFAKDGDVVRFYLGKKLLFICSREQLNCGLAAMDDADLADSA